MIKNILIVAGFVVLIAALIFGVYYGIRLYQDRYGQPETVVSVTGDQTASVPDVGTDITPLPLEEGVPLTGEEGISLPDEEGIVAPEETGLETIELPVGEEVETGQPATGDTRSGTTTQNMGAAIKTPPKRITPTREVQRQERPATSSSSTSEEETGPITGEPTVIPETTTGTETTTPTTTTTDTETATPATTTTGTETTPIQPPTPGTYSVQTIEPVLQSQLPAIRKAMNALGVRLNEQKIGQQNLQGYRVAVGYFRTKAEAESWAQYNFKPRGVAYYVYAVQNMYSLQIGFYTQPQNADVAMQELYRKFPGWRLPARRELAPVSQTAYTLSLNRITKSLADRIWRELFRMGIDAGISGL